MNIKREKVDVKEEFAILSYMIMNKVVALSAYNKYKSGQLKTKHFTIHFRPIFRWIVSYYSDHHKPPKRTIKKIFNKRRKSLNNEAQEIIEECLTRLAQEFSNFQDDNIDPEYICKEILPDFIREREITAKIDNAQNKIDQGKYKEAENIISTYTPIVEEDEDKNLGTIIPFTKEDVRLSTNDKAIDKVFKFSGDLHEMVGWLGKPWLVAITGIEKSSKSFVLQEIAFQAALYQKKKVLIINLELVDSLVRNRLKRRISLTANRKDAGLILTPILDCENNQYGICKVRHKAINKKNLLKNNMDLIRYSDYKKWKICERCRGLPVRGNTTKTRRFIPALWFRQSIIRETTDDRVLKSIKNNASFNLSNLRVKCFPRYSVTFDEVYSYIRRYVDKTGWKPDIIGFDYLDILAQEEANLQERIDVDRKWKKAAKLAGEMNCLVITPDQATKAGRTQYALDQMSTSESKTKDGHLDLRIAVNQTDDEQDLGIARINVLFHRHASFNIKHEVLITRRLSTAEPLMDNARLFDRGKKYHVIME